MEKLLPLLGAWTLLGWLGWALWQNLQGIWHQAQQMHRIPCSGCEFFTGDYRLKCTVRPQIASTEAAIDCLDYLPGTK